MEKILEIKNLSKNYGHVQAVNNLSFEVEKGHVYGLLGPNGSGKSTTLGMILNVINPSAGHYLWFGKETSTHSHKRIGALIERPNFYPYLSATENLKIVAEIKEVPHSKIDEKLELVNLYERRMHKFGTYSLGMKQRLAIAAAMLNDPEVLVLDEPTNGLDPKGIAEIRKIIKTIAAEGTTIILASHLLDEVEKVCSHVIVLQKGKNIFNGRVGEMANKAGILELGCDDNAKLLELMKTHPSVLSIKVENDILYCDLKEEINSKELNKWLIEEDITLTHLANKKISLEEQFLDLTNNNK